MTAKLALKCCDIKNLKSQAYTVFSVLYVLSQRKLQQLSTTQFVNKQNSVLFTFYFVFGIREKLDYKYWSVVRKRFGNPAIEDIRTRNLLGCLIFLKILFFYFLL